MENLRNSIEFKLGKVSGLLGVIFAILTDRKNVDAHFTGEVTRLQSTHSNTRLSSIVMTGLIVIFILIMMWIINK